MTALFQNETIIVKTFAQLFILSCVLREISFAFLIAYGVTPIYVSALSSDPEQAFNPSFKILCTFSPLRISLYLYILRHHLVSLALLSLTVLLPEAILYMLLLLISQNATAPSLPSNQFRTHLFHECFQSFITKGRWCYFCSLYLNNLNHLSLFITISVLSPFMLFILSLFPRW